MAHDLATLQAMRDGLQEARAKGHRKYEIEGMSMEFRSDSELRVAIADLDRQIANLSRPKSGAVTFSTSKGV